MKLLLPLWLAVVVVGSTAIAESPRIVVDLPVTGALVEAVTGPDAPPVPLMDENADPHHAALKPSQARAVETAGLVVRMGGDITPWLDRALRNRDSNVLELQAGEEHAHGHGAHAGDNHDGHGHGTDPHLWLDPAFAVSWLDGIAERLTAADPQQRNAYGARAPAAETDLAAALKDVEERIARAGRPKILAARDAWSRAAGHFGLNIVDAISDHQNAAPGAARLSRLRELFAAGEVDCILAAPGDDLRHIPAITEGAPLPVVEAQLQGDPERRGMARYVSVFTSLAAAVETCAGG